MSAQDKQMYSQAIRAFLKPVLKYLDDPDVSEIMINNPDDIWIEKKGLLYKTKARFTKEGLAAACRNIAQYVGRVVNQERPRVDARLPDGSRIHIILHPIARRGTTMCIRKFFPRKLSLEDLIPFGSITEEAVEFIKACVVGKINLIVSGGTGSGKTTFLNAASKYIPNSERIITIEDSAELQLSQEHLVSLETRPPDKHGRGEVTMRDLLISSLRMRPDRIIIGEIRSGEAFDYLQAINTGHAGSMCTIHANSAIEALYRLESLCLMSDVDMPIIAIRAQIASALELVVCVNRFEDGSRKVTQISEVLPLSKKGDYRIADIFVFERTGKSDDGKVLGYLSPTGVIPTFMRRLIVMGFKHIDEAFFNPESYGYKPPEFFIIPEDGGVKLAKEKRNIDIKRKESQKDLKEVSKTTVEYSEDKTIPGGVKIPEELKEEKTTIEDS